MSSKYGVGEILIVYGITDHFQFLNSTECTVIGVANSYSVIGTNGIEGKLFGYSVETEDRVLRVIPEMYLKRKPPSRGDMNKKVSWDDMCWKPSKEYMQASWVLSSLNSDVLK